MDKLDRLEEMVVSREIYIQKADVFYRFRDLDDTNNLKLLFEFRNKATFYSEEIEKLKEEIRGEMNG